MFTLNEPDKAGFAKYKKFLDMPKVIGVGIEDLEDREKSIALAGLNEHHAAYSFAREILSIEVDFDNPHHQKVLSLALSAQRDPAQWQNLDITEQRTLLHLLAVRDDQANRRQHADNLLCNLRGDAGHIANAFTRHPAGNLAVRGATLFFRNMSNRDVSSGIGPDIIKHLNKLDPKEFLSDKIPLNLKGLQEIQRKIAMLSDTAEFLKRYGLSIDKLKASVKNELGALIGEYKQPNKADLFKDEREKFEQRLKGARNTFSRITKLGQDNKIPELITIGAIGDQGTNIVEEIAKLTGKVPGLAAPTGIAMLFPMANIAVAAVSIFCLLKPNKNKDNAPDPIQVKLAQISRQIESLRTEMHARFDQVDKQLKEILEKTLIGFQHLEAIIKADNASIKIALTTMFQYLAADINVLQELTEKGLIDIRLDPFKNLISDTESLVDGNWKDLKDAKDQLVKTVEQLEKHWLLRSVNEEMLNGGRHYNADQTVNYRRVANIANYVLNKDINAILGYLARFAKHNVGIDIPTIDLPNVELLSQGVKLSLAARTRLKQYHHYDFDKHPAEGKGEQEFYSPHLQDIKNSVKNAVQFIEILGRSPKILFDKLFAIYTDGLKTLEEKIIILMAKQEQANFGGKKLSLINIKLGSIKGHPELAANRFLTTLSNTMIPEIIIEGQKNGLVHWQADYKGSATSASVYLSRHTDTDFWGSTYTTGGVLTTIIPSASYNITLTCIINGIPIRFFTTTFSKLNPAQSQSASGRSGFQGLENDERNFNNCWGNKSSTQVLQEFWTASTHDKNPEYDEKAIAAHFPALALEIIKKKWNAAKGDVKNEGIKGQIGNLNEWYKRNTLKDKQQIKTALNDINEIELMNAMDKVKAAHALIHAYGRLLGLSQDLLTRLAQNLISDLPKLLDNLALFDTQHDLAEKLKQEVLQISMFDEVDQPGLSRAVLNEKLPLSNKSKSMFRSNVWVKAMAIIQTIEFFEQTVFCNDIFNPDWQHAQTINGRFISAEKLRMGELVPGGAEGGFGEVRTALWMDANKVVAVKEMRGIKDEKAFVQEIENLSVLQSNHIIKVYGYTKRAGKYGLVMELAEKSLQQCLKEKMSIAIEQKKKWAFDIARGLAYLHQRQIIHKDIKSLNILLDEKGVAKIADFGLAISKTETKMATLSASTISGDSLSTDVAKEEGSILWRAPETIRHKRTDKIQYTEKSDVYSFGVVLWEILTRKTPFLTDNSDLTVSEIKDFILAGDLEAIPDEIPELRKLIQECREKDPNKRPSMQQIVERLMKAFPELCQGLEGSAPKQDKNLDEKSSAKIGAADHKDLPKDKEEKARPIDASVKICHLPGKEEKFAEVDVTGDGSCLPYSVAFSYMLPVLHDQKQFGARCVNLFGRDKISDSSIANLHRFLQGYRGEKHFVTTDIGGELEALIDYSFRENFIKYMRDHRTDYAGFFEQDAKSNAKDQFESYLASQTKPKEWCGEHEIRAISEMLKVRIEIYVPPSADGRFAEPRVHGARYAETIRLVHAEGGAHYHYLIPFNLLNQIASVPSIAPGLQANSMFANSSAIDANKPPVNLTGSCYKVLS